MSPEEVKALIQAGLPDCDVEVDGDGSHFMARIVGEVFAGKTPVQKQKMVYATVNEHIVSGAIHALTIRAYTPDEWSRASKLQIST